MRSARNTPGWWTLFQVVIGVAVVLWFLYVLLLAKPAEPAKTTTPTSQIQLVPGDNQTTTAAPPTTSPSSSSTPTSSPTTTARPTTTEVNTLAGDRVALPTQAVDAAVAAAIATEPGSTSSTVRLVSQSPEKLVLYVVISSDTSPGHPVNVTLTPNGNQWQVTQAQ